MFRIWTLRLGMAIVLLVLCFPPPGTVWGDEQGGGCVEGTIRDSYEARAGQGWQVSATSPQGDKLTTSAQSDGTFHFSNLAAGKWTIRINAPAQGWTPMSPSEFPVTPTGRGGQGCAQVAAWFKANGTIAVEMQDAVPSTFNRVTFQPWQVEVAQGGAVAGSCSTDWAGRCAISLPPGTYSVHVTDQMGWRIRLPNPIEKKVEAGRALIATFVAEQVTTSAVMATKRDTAGKPVPGTAIAVAASDGYGVPTRVTTNALGDAFFASLPLGQYIVSETVGPGYLAAGPISQTVTLGQPGITATVSFTNERALTIQGKKVNSLGQGMANWTIVASNPARGLTETVTTGADGLYKFDKLVAGNWVVKEVMQERWTAVTADTITATLSITNSPYKINFENKTDCADLDVLVQHYSVRRFGSSVVPVYTPLAGWTISVQPKEGGTRQSAITDGAGRVSFSCLRPGTYIVEEAPPDVAPCEWSPKSSPSQEVKLEPTGTAKQVVFVNEKKPYPSCWTAPVVNAAPRPMVSGTGAPALGAAAPACSAMHTVSRGDNLTMIARRYHSTVAAIMKANSLLSTIIHRGNKLCIP